ncbi:site-specific DNA-methyltransferase [Ureibacillus sp. Re31]|uniref:Site-specific DNA-methyltransferase n=1 Tax=Ureibacillus galli TaxID=2762222 RepID=A0ABR8X8E0_9BACL|nr:site-specific DNA-methyltransferase [Ureibacillus galli]MBD8025580.1 site-specific DNA-methyltransferase [Ureibacillus galli]
METKVQFEIKNVLKDFPDYWENNSLIKSRVIDDLRNYKKELIEKLLSNEIIRQTYTLEITNGTVFKVEEFISMLRYKNYWENSYTRYSNEIGLTSDDKYFKYNTDVVLNFPHKDCILEGGMTKEDVGKNEVYYHKVLAKEEIDILLSPKVLTNIKKYDQNGEHSVTEFNDTDNLIIKGNNLIALHTLKERYAGKIKLIYIDIPYNTGSDSFRYNDRFNHSTWLTFIKNRLEVAKELLTEDGSIFVQIDDNEDSYLKVLMDEIFGRECFRNKITWKRRGGSANPSNRLNNVVDYILWYVKDAENFYYTPVFSLNDENTQKYIKERFTHLDENGRRYMKSPIQSPNYRENLIYDYKGYKTPAKGYSVSREVLEQWDKEGKLAFPDDKSKNINRKIYLDEYKGQPINSLWTDIYVINPMSKERTEFTSGQKPEALIKRIIEMVTEEGDIVLDFFMGSATTQATALKMNRQFIGIEQMDYINTFSIPRLREVIEGNQGGVSKEVGWNGGGSFVYTELYPLNQKYVEQIQNTNSDEDIENLIKRIKVSAFLDFKIKIDKVTNKNNDFTALSLEEKKDLLIQVLDANQLYLSYFEIDDEQYCIPEPVKQFNRSFYSKKKVGKKHE